MSKAIQKLIDEAYELVAHWERWPKKDTEHTSEYVAALSESLLALKGDRTMEALPQIADFLDDMARRRDSVDWDMCGDEVRAEAKRLRAMLNVGA